MTYGLYAGISARDLGWEPDEPVCKCPKCGGDVYYHHYLRNYTCSECLEVYGDMDAIYAADQYYLALFAEMNGDDQRDEDASGYADTVAAGLERWTR